MPEVGFEAECQECGGILYRGPFGKDAQATAAIVAKAADGHRCPIEVSRGPMGCTDPDCRNMHENGEAAMACQARFDKVAERGA